MDEDLDFLDEPYLADELFFSFVDLAGLPQQGSLEGASGLKADPGPYVTNLVERCETAWRTPYRDLTCEQVRTLLSQRMGLQWLATPILQFSTRHPAATIMNYPGEMVLLSLQAASELLAAAPDAFRDWVAGDFGWLERVFGWDRKLLEEAEAGLKSARELAGPA